MVRLVVAVIGRYIIGLLGNVAHFVELVVRSKYRIRCLLCRYARQPAVGVEAIVGDDAVWQRNLAVPDPLIIQADLSCWRADCFRLIVLVVGVAVGDSFGAGEGLFVAPGVVAVGVGFCDCADCYGFAGFAVGCVVADRGCHVRRCIAGQVAVLVILEGVFRIVGKLGFRQPVGLVVGIGCRLVFGIGDRFQQAVGIIGIRRRLPFRPGFFCLSPCLVILKRRGVILRVGESEQVAFLVVREAGNSALGVGLAFYAAQCVVAVCCQVAVGVCSCRDPPYLVIGEVRQVVQGIADLFDPAQLVQGVGGDIVQRVGDDRGGGGVRAAVAAGAA